MLHIRSCLLLLAVIACAPTALGHFPILIHDGIIGATNGPVTILFATGHPFELDMEPAERPSRLRWLDRRGRSTDITANLTRTLFRGDTNGVAWQYTFNPPMDDLLVALDSEAAVDARQKTLYREYVKLWMHRGRQDNWHQRTGQPLEIVPLTRPYGLQAGMSFAGRLMRQEQPVPDTDVYFERLNDSPPDPVPPEPLITFVVRTDAEGRFAFTLNAPGWWIVGAYSDDLGSTTLNGDRWQLEGFAGAWLHVEQR